MFSKVGELCVKEQLNVPIHHFRFDLMELEDLCDLDKRLQAKPRADSGLRPSSDKELDFGDLIHITGED